MEAYSLALGGADQGSWLWLAFGGREQWSELLDATAPVDLQELYATSGEDDLLHPAAVPLASPTTLRELIETIDEELGGGALVVDVRLLVTRAPRLVFTAHREGSVRLEAASDDAFLPLVERWSGVAGERWRRLFKGLRDEMLTGRYTRVELADRGWVVRSYASRADYDNNAVDENVEIA